MANLSQAIFRSEAFCQSEQAFSGSSTRKYSLGAELSGW